MDNYHDDKLKNDFIKFFKKTYLLEFKDGKYILLPIRYKNRGHAESILDYYMSEQIFLEEIIDNNSSKKKIRKYEQDIINLQGKVVEYKKPSNFSCFHDSPSDQYS